MNDARCGRLPERESQRANKEVNHLYRSIQNAPLRLVLAARFFVCSNWRLAWTPLRSGATVATMTKIRTSRGELSRWLLPAQLLDIVQMQADEIGGCVFLRTNAAKFLREAWVIGKAGVLLGATRARLSRDDPPDGYLEIDGVGTLPIEVTELLQKGRCRGDENHSLEIIHQEHEELTAAIEHNAEWLQELICKKLARDRNYPPKTVLLVYHNTSLYNFCPNRTRSEFEDASRRRGENIVGSLIMYGEQIYGRALLQGSALGGY